MQIFWGKVQVYTQDYNFVLANPLVKRSEHAQKDKSSAPLLLQFLSIQKFKLIFKALKMH